METPDKNHPKSPSALEVSEFADIIWVDSIGEVYFRSDSGKTMKSFGMFKSDEASGALVLGEAGFKMTNHYHPRSTEFLFVIKGKMKVYFEGSSEPKELLPKDHMTLPASIAHWVEIVEKTLFVVIVMPKDNGFPEGIDSLNNLFSNWEEDPTVVV